MWTMTTVRATTATTFAINGVISLPKKSLDSQQSSQETPEQLRCDQRGGRCVGCWSVWWCVAAGAADRKLLSVEVSAVKSRNSGRSGSVRPEQQQQHNGATVTSQTDTEKSRHIYTRLHNLHRYRCPLQFCFLFQTYFLDLILENENCFSCPGPSTPVLSCLIQISGLTEPRVASCTPHLMSILMSTLKIYPIIHWRGPLIVKTDHSPHFEFVQFSVFTRVWPDCLWWPSRCADSHLMSPIQMYSVCLIFCTEFHLGPVLNSWDISYFARQEAAGSVLVPDEGSLAVAVPADPVKVRVAWLVQLWL